MSPWVGLGTVISPQTSPSWNYHEKSKNGSFSAVFRHKKVILSRHSLAYLLLLFFGPKTEVYYLRKPFISEHQKLLLYFATVELLSVLFWRCIHYWRSLAHFISHPFSLFSSKTELWSWKNQHCPDEAFWKGVTDHCWGSWDSFCLGDQVWMYPTQILPTQLRSAWAINHVLVAKTEGKRHGFVKKLHQSELLEA